MRTLGRAVFIIFLGLTLGAVHSYCAPFKIRPDNNPEVPAASGNDGGTGTAVPPKGVEGGGANPAAPVDTPIKPPDPPPPKPPEAATPNYFVTVDKAKEYFDKGLAQNIVFVDARPAKDYVAGHVAGAMHLPPFEGISRKAVDNLPGMTVVIYCHGATCTDSQAVMVGLQNLKRDIGPIFIMKDGIDPWKAKFPSLMEAGPDRQFGP